MVKRLYLLLCTAVLCLSVWSQTLGDVTGEGTVDVSDVNAAINIILEIKTEADYPCSADLTGDGKVDVSDVNAIINIILNGPTQPSMKTFTVNGVTFRMILVESGTFTMGATEEQGTSIKSNELPLHEVTLSSYYIGETPITQELWVAVMGGSNTSYFSSRHGYTDDLQRPMEWVPWNNCVRFLAKLNELTGETFRFPTEAEWEFAARGGNKSERYRYSGSNTIGDVAWYWSNIPSRKEYTDGYGTQPVATKAPNELGIYDMTGNVWEWCSDYYGEYSSEPQTNPMGPDTGTRRVLRGGCWSNDPPECRISYRGSGDVNGYCDGYGLRIAL